MVKIETKFRCEICKDRYNNLEDAIQCESEGKPSPIYMRGDVFKYDKNIICLIIKPKIDGHGVYYDCYWFRDSHHGDSTKLEVSRQSESSINTKSVINSNMPAYKRLLKLAKKRQIKTRVICGYKN